MLLRGACGGLDQETQSPVQHDQDVRGEAPKHLHSSAHTHPCAGRHDRRAAGLGRLRWGTEAAAQTTHGDSAHASRQRRPNSAANARPACRSIPARNLCPVPGVPLDQATLTIHQELCICKSESIRPCVAVCHSILYQLCCRVCLCCSSPLSAPIARSISPANRTF